MAEPRDRTKSNIKVKERLKARIRNSGIKSQRLTRDRQTVAGSDLVFGIDNGATGTLCAWRVADGAVDFIETPSVVVDNYQKQIRKIDRIDWPALNGWLERQIAAVPPGSKISAVIQRPMVNPQRFDASLNAVRAFQATILALEIHNIGYIVIDSRKWQKHFMGSNTVLLDLKKESMKIGQQMMRQQSHRDVAQRHGDADAFLIAAYAVQKLV